MVDRRHDFPVERTLCIELLADAFMTSGNTRYRNAVPHERRDAASSLLDELRRRKLWPHQYPAVVPFGGFNLVVENPVQAKRPALYSDRKLREHAAAAWHEIYRKRRDPFHAFAVAMRVTLDQQPTWTIEDAVIHTLEFVLPPDLKRK